MRKIPSLPHLSIPLALFFVAVLWRLLIGLMLYTLDTPFPVIGTDSHTYVQLAYNILEHGNLYPDDISPTSLRRPPGYPFFLFIIFSIYGSTVGPYIASLIQIIAWGISTVWLYEIIKKCAGHTPAVIAALLFALEPNAAYYSTLLLSDGLFVFFSIAATRSIFFLQQPFRGGAFLGVSALIRSIAQFLPLYNIIPLLYVHKNNKRQALTIIAISALCFLIITMPWMLYNKFTIGIFDISSSGTSTYYRYVLPSFIAVTEKRDYEEVRQQLIQNLDNPTKTPENVMAHTITQYIQHHPLQYMTFHILKTTPFFLSDGIREILQKINVIDTKQPNFTLLALQGDYQKILTEIKDKPSTLIGIAGAALWLIIICLMLIALSLYRKKQKPERTLIVIALSTIVYFALLTGPATTTRHRMPALPWIATLAAIGFCHVVDLRHTKTKS